jgi:hypothetical protein
MAVYYPSDCEVEIPDHICDPCETREKGRIGSTAFIKTSFEFTDPSDPTEWQTGINAGDIIIIPEVLGSFDGGTEVEGAGYGRQSTSLLGYNFTANFKDPNYKSNCTFYNLLKNSRAWKFAYKTETQIHITNNPVQVIPKNPVTEELNSDVVWDVTVKWDDQDLPCPFDEPAGIFTCFTVAP